MGSKADGIHYDGPGKEDEGENKSLSTPERDDGPQGCAMWFAGEGKVPSATGRIRSQYETALCFFTDLEKDYDNVLYYTCTGLTKLCFLTLEKHYDRLLFSTYIKFRTLCFTESKKYT